MKKNLDIKLMLLGLGCMGYAASVCSYFVTRTQNSFYESAQAFLGVILPFVGVVLLLIGFFHKLKEK